MRLVRSRPPLRLAALCLCVGAALIAIAATPALAAQPGVYQATAQPSYQNPDTGAVEDAAGQSNVALGESMVTGVVQPDALVEVDGQGSTYATLRFNLANEIGQVLVAADADHTGSFAEEQAAEQVQVLGEGDVADYRFAIPSEDATLRLNMYVEPMGRDVVYFVTLGGLAQGNDAGFVEFVDATAAPDDTLEVDAAASMQDEGEAAPATTDGPASESEGQALTADAEEAAPAAADELSSQSGAEVGIREYSGDGTEVTGAGAQPDDQATGSVNYPLVIGTVVALAAVAALVGYFAVAKPRRARQDAAAAAAAGVTSSEE